MSKAKKVLPDHLLGAVASHLNPDGDAGQSTKAVAKTLNKLAKQFRKQRKASAAPAEPAAPAAPTAKQARKALTGELTTALQPYLTPSGSKNDGLSKPVTKAVKDLATHLAKQNRRQAKLATKAAASAPEAVAPAAAKAPAARKPKPAAARSAAVAAPAPARRRAPAPKQPATPTVADATSTKNSETA